MSTAIGFDLSSMFSCSFCNNRGMAEDETMLDFSTSKFVGVGIVFDAGEEGKGPHGEGLVVSHMTAGGPAQQCHRISEGDVMVAIDNSDVRGFTTNEISRLILGEEGSRVKLGFETPSTPKIYYEVVLERRQPRVYQ